MSITKEFANRTRPIPDTENRAGGPAFSRSAEATVASFVGAGTVNGSFYTDPRTQIEMITEALAKCSIEFIADCAVYSRHKAFLKDMPAIFAAHLFCRGPEGVEALEAIFYDVIDNGKMLRNFFNIIRSGRFGRKNITGRAMKRMLTRWIVGRSPRQLMVANIGNNPELRDIIRMVRPNASGQPDIEATLGWIVNGSDSKHKDRFPEHIRLYEAYKKCVNDDGSTRNGLMRQELPNVHWQYLTALPLNEVEWGKIAFSARLQTTLMNLNTFKRHNVFENSRVATEAIIKRLCDPNGTQEARLFPFQVLRAIKNVDTDIPRDVFGALDICLENSLKNVRVPDGKTLIAVDCSGSMGWHGISGRDGKLSVSSAEIGGLFAAALWKRSDDVDFIGWDARVYNPERLGIRPNMDIATIAERCQFGGATDAGCIFDWAEKYGKRYDLIIIISDGESWSGYRNINQRFETYGKSVGKTPLLACIDIVGTQTQLFKDKRGRMHISGFNDSVFDGINRFAETGGDPEAYMKMIEGSAKNKA